MKKIKEIENKLISIIDNFLSKENETIRIIKNNIYEFKINCTEAIDYIKENIHLKI